MQIHARTVHSEHCFSLLCSNVNTLNIFFLSQQNLKDVFFFIKLGFAVWDIFVLFVWNRWGGSQ